MFELAVFDLDGTLLDNQHEISDANIEAIKKLHKNGCKIVIATGRPRTLTQEYKEKIGVCEYTISCNGALIEDEKKGKLIKNVILNKKIVKDILEMCKKTNSICMVYTHDAIITEYNYKVERYERRNEGLPENLKAKVVLSSDPEYISNTFDANKVLIIEENEERYKELVKILKKYHDLSVTSSNIGFIDIMKQGVGKKEGVELLGKILNIKPENILAAGDNYNDLEMLQYVGGSITTSNGVDAVKAVSKFVSKSNDESGIAWAINTLLNDEQTWDCK